LYEGNEVAARGDVSAAAVGALHPLPRTVERARREIQTLRSINAHLVRQIDLLKRREAQAQHLADRDGLTGLYNGRKMHDLLARSVEDARRRNGRAGLLFIDVDGFKRVNDVHGHSCGDLLLTRVASRITARARTGDLVCRYGGDEFVVILPQLVDAASAGEVADSIRRRVALPYRLGGVDVQVTAAVGTALYPDDARTPEALMRLADQSMYREKSRCRDADEILRDAQPPARRRDDIAKPFATP
jgi:diguanylate cyclase (GGDEF)-like protein